MMASMMGLKSIETMGVAGAAIEHRSLLGRVLRFSPDPADPKLVDLFRNTHKESQKVADSNMNMIRNHVNVVQTIGHDLIMAVLKTGGSSKEKMMRWLLDTIEYNMEAEKERPSPFLAASSGFLFNLGGVMLKICRPVLTDPEKLKKIDWNYLFSDESSSVFRSELTKLTTPPVGALPEIISDTVEFNFITQSFFMTWKVLHLGSAQQCGNYVNILRSLNHFRAGLEIAEPRSVHYLLLKICADINLLSSNFLNNIVLFVCGACQSLLWYLDDNSASGWLALESDMLPRARALLGKIPEHLIDDIMDIMLFVAKTEPSTFGLCSLSPLLSLIVFFLRRPWAVVSPHLR
jgi:ubiquitin conjugation factor E4 B